MNTFLKTFFLCLIIAFGFLGYKCIHEDSYSLDLNVSKNNPVFGVHENLPDAKPVDKTEIVDKRPVKSDTQTKVDEQKQVKNNEKYDHKCYFYSNNGSLVLVSRQLAFKPSLENSIMVLLKGPMIAEAKKGIYSEIPTNVDLIAIRRLNKDVIVDLSSNFGNGGGTKSITDRVSQLAKTVKIHEPNKNVYLYINGKEVEYLGGDGVYIKQPLE